MDHYQSRIVELFKRGVAGVNPAKLISETLSLRKGKLHVCEKAYPVKDNIYLVGFGKAVLGMASQCEKILEQHLKKGIISCPENIQLALKDSEFLLKPNSVIQIHEGARNNLPDENAEKATDAIIKLVKSLDSKNDSLIILVSGGGSALLPKPKPGLSLSDKVKTINLLVSVGADVQEMNTVRKKISVVKGGGLANLAYPVQGLCFIISDVINDTLDLVASGPTVPDNGPDLAAFSILKKYNLENKVPETVLIETKKNSNNYFSNKEFSHLSNFLIGSNKKALSACKEYSEQIGFKPLILSASLNGFVEDVSEYFIKIIQEILLYKKNPESNIHSLKQSLNSNFDEDVTDKLVEIQDPNSNLCIISGGETTVRITGKGKGGRSQQLALLMSMKIYDLKTKSPELFDAFDVVFLSAGTDGIDGATDAAGAVGHADIIEKAKQIGIDPNSYLLDNDSYNFYKAIDNGSYLIKTGHTGTNVMDIYAFMIYKKSS